MVSPLRHRQQAMPGPSPLADLARELHRASTSTSFTDDGRETILAYVRNHPGAPVSEVIARGRGSLSRSEAGRVIRDLLAGEKLRRPPPGVRLRAGPRAAVHQPISDTEHVNVDVRVRGLDGKLYTARPLTRQERARAIRVAHHLVHQDGLSIRAAQQVMAETYGLRRSVGAIAADLAGYECPACADT